MVGARAVIPSAEPRSQEEDRGFFVEVGVDDGRGQAVVLRSSGDAEALVDCARGVGLPEYQGVRLRKT